MAITVCKFGGSSVSDADMFMRVMKIIKSCAARRYIVLSAPGKRYPGDEKITDLFYQACKAARCGDYSILSRIFNRYASIRNALAPEFDLEYEFAQIRAKLHTSMDYAASRGEYLCAKLFAAYAKLPFVDAAELLFFSNDGEFDGQRSRTAVLERLTPLPCAVIPGFYGFSDAGIKTFSRGGSDVSGALISAYLHADTYENWTDVDGLYTADPRIVHAPIRNLQVNLDEMTHISAAGASLLHPDSLNPLRGTGIDTIIKNTFAPGSPGTRISEGFRSPVRCVTGKREMYLSAAALNEGAAEPLLYSFPMDGLAKVAVVSVFGMRPEQMLRLKALLTPIHIIHMQNHIQIIIPQKEYESTIRAVHALLTED